MQVSCQLRLVGEAWGRDKPSAGPHLEFTLQKAAACTEGGEEFPERNKTSHRELGVPATGFLRFVKPINSHQGRRCLVAEGSLISQTRNAIQVLEAQVSGVNAGNRIVSLQEKAIGLLQGAVRSQTLRGSASRPTLPRR